MFPNTPSFRNRTPSSSWLEDGSAGDYPPPLLFGVSNKLDSVPKDVSGSGVCSFHIMPLARHLCFSSPVAQSLPRGRRVDFTPRMKTTLRFMEEGHQNGRSIDAWMTLGFPFWGHLPLQAFTCKQSKTLSHVRHFYFAYW